MYKKLLDKIFKIIDQNLIVLVILYGKNQWLVNRKDVDLLVIIHGNHGYENRLIKNLDVSIIGEKKFTSGMKLLDPLVIEPILTGKKIYGTGSESYKSQIKMIRPSKKVIQYLTHQSFLFFNWALWFYYSHRRDNLGSDLQNKCLINLSFCLSYWCFAKHYESSHKIINFKQLIIEYEDSLLYEVHTYLKANKRNLQKIRGFLINTVKLLTS